LISRAKARAASNCGRTRIRVNAIAPGLTIADGIATTEPFAGWIAQSRQRQALEGHATPEDIAGAAAFLASADARFITGTILTVDGGITAASGLPDFS
jgi:meso-butanediol dehydrogenase/(S,S)-butanediol dehydrogenase/diacetyl reductase